MKVGRNARVRVLQCGPRWLANAVFPLAQNGSNSHAKLPAACGPACVGEMPHSRIMRSGPPKRSRWAGRHQLAGRCQPHHPSVRCRWNVPLCTSLCAPPDDWNETAACIAIHPPPGTLHDAEDQPPPPSEFTPRFTRRRAPPSHGVPDWPRLTRTARRRVIGARPAREIEWEWEARWARTLAGSMWLLLSPSVLGRCVCFLSSFYCCVFSPQGVGGSRGLECRSSNFLAQ